MDICTECKDNISNTADVVYCDSCNRSFHKKPCSGLNASEIKVMELKGSRQLRFFCKDCQKGFLQVPTLIKAVDELRQELNDIKATINGASMEATTSAANLQSVAALKDNEILVELQERQKRASNVMLFNVPEGRDLDEAKVILSILTNDPPNILHVSRLGKSNTNNARALKLTLPSPNDAQKLVKNGYKLKGKKIYINLDLTAKQRELDKKLVTELKARKERGENVTIRYQNGHPHIVQRKN